MVGPIDVGDISAAIELAVGDPDLVLVDRRVLRLLMGDLAELLVLSSADKPFTVRGPFALQLELPPGERPYVWDDDDPCK